MTEPAPGAVAARDERRHQAPSGVRGWCEWFTWELQPAGDEPAVTIRLVLHGDRCWYLAGVVAPGRPLTVVTDLDVPLPSGPASLEVRTTGLWADHNVETPLAHVSVGLEAFGVTLDDPVDALTDGFGERVPVGFDLEWEDDRAPVAAFGEGRYEVPGRAHGEILLGRDRHEVDGSGQREHAWGVTDWHGPGWWRASIRWDDGRHTVARGAAGAPGAAVTASSSGACSPAVPAALALHRDDWGLPVAARLDAGGTGVALVAEASVPVPLSGRHGALVSVLVSSADPPGRGWLEIAGPIPTRD